MLERLELAITQVVVVELRYLWMLVIDFRKFDNAGLPTRRESAAVAYAVLIDPVADCRERFGTGIVICLRIAGFLLAGRVRVRGESQGAISCGIVILGRSSGDSRTEGRLELFADREGSRLQLLRFVWSAT